MRAGTMEAEISVVELEKGRISERYNPYPNSTHSYTNERKELKRFVQLKNVFKQLEVHGNTKYFPQKFYSKAMFICVPFRVGLSVPSLRSFLAV